MTVDKTARKNTEARLTGGAAGNRQSSFKMLILFTALASTAVFASERPVLKPADVFGIISAHDPQVSPDGRRIVYVQVRANVINDRWNSSRRVVDNHGRNNRPITEVLDEAD